MVRIDLFFTYIMNAFRKIIDSVAQLISRTNRKKFTVSIEGNIASGKTTFLSFLDGERLCQVVGEPVAKWRDINGENALARLYEDPKRWSMAFETYVQLTMLERHFLSQIEPIKLIERSIFSAQYCFVENLYRARMMDKMEYDILTRWFDWIVTNQDVHIDLIVYLRTEPEALHERIMQRGRKEETSITLEYLRKLHQRHEDWLIKKEFPVPCPVLVIDADMSLIELERECQRHKGEILFGLDT